MRWPGGDGMTSLFRQVWVVTLMNLRSISQRLGASAVVVIGIGGVVAVLVSVLAMSTGMIRTMESSGRDDRAVVMRNGATAEVSSVIERSAVRLISEGVGVRRTETGEPLISAEALRVLSLLRKDDDAEINAILRGVGPRVLDVRPELTIVAGRMFRPAVAEVIVGQSAHRQFKGVDVGDEVVVRGLRWKVVGVFTSGGDAHESSLLTDADTMLSLDRRSDFQSVTALLSSPGAFESFRDSLTSHPELAVDVLREREYYRQQSEAMSRIISVIAYVVGGIMAVGAVFGALNTMYSAVSARLQEIATLRAIGFGATAVVVSVLAEALLLSLLGGALGSLIAWLFFHGNTVSTIGGFGQLVFQLNVDAGLVTLGIVWSCVIGLIGGLFPAVRAARQPVAMALRAV